MRTNSVTRFRWLFSRFSTANRLTECDVRRTLQLDIAFGVLLWDAPFDYMVRQSQTGATDHSLCGGVPLYTTRSMDESGIGQLGRELSQLLEQQMKATLGRSFDDLSDEELAAYKERRKRIGTLRAELAKFAHPM